MKKNLLTVALLVSFFQSKAQLTTVAEGAVMTVRPGTLVYNGGGLKTVGDGKVDNYGNFMIVGTTTGTADKFETVQSASGLAKLNGGNFNLKYADASIGSTYGQLFITNLRQIDITGVVDKEYRATANGTFQQMALPFFNKKLSGSYTSVATATETPTLSFDLSTTGFSNLRNTNSVGYWENQRVLMHNLPNTATTSTMAVADVNTAVNNNAARYYAVGAANWTPTTTHNIVGVPFSDISSSAAANVLNSASNPLTYTLSGAGYISGLIPIPYGVGTGNNNNGVYNEQYKTYLQDSFGIASNQGFYNGTIGSESGTFGRNLYQFGNPFLTNIDLSRVGYDEDGSGSTQDDLNNLTNIYGIRYESGGVVTSNLGSTSSTSFKFITFGPGGIPTGDYLGAIIKPMQAFVIKLRDNSATNQNLIFNSLRRFSYTRRLANTPYSVTAAKNSSTQKQLRIIGLDSSGNEVMRTYYVVGSNLATGRFNDIKVQAAAYSGALSTREELQGGGEDTVANGLYWLYINEANEVDHFGKKIRMVANLTSITSFKFELAEDAIELPDGISAFANGGHSFYIEQTPGVYTQISHNQIIPATSANSGLYYGQPNSSVLGTSEVTKDDELFIAHEDKSNTHQVIFPKSWNKATVTVYDMAGRKIFTEKDIRTKENFILPLNSNAAYLVECISDNGVKVVKKVLK